MRCPCTCFFCQRGDHCFDEGCAAFNDQELKPKKNPSDLSISVYDETKITDHIGG